MSVCLRNVCFWEGREEVHHRDVYVKDGKFGFDWINVDQTWDLSDWLVLPGLVFYLECGKEVVCIKTLILASSFGFGNHF